jgi:hypothetical protein
VFPTAPGLPPLTEPSASESSPRCHHCRSKELHSIFKVSHSQDHCPIKSVARAKAVKARTAALKEIKEDPKRASEILSEVLEKFE